MTSYYLLICMGKYTRLHLLRYMSINTGNSGSTKHITKYKYCALKLFTTSYTSTWAKTITFKTFHPFHYICSCIRVTIEIRLKQYFLMDETLASTDLYPLMFYRQEHYLRHLSFSQTLIIICPPCVCICLMINVINISIITNKRRTLLANLQTILKMIKYDTTTLICCFT